MYTVSDAVEMGNARELILSEEKVPGQADDFDFITLRAGEHFDE